MNNTASLALATLLLVPLAALHADTTCLKFQRLENSLLVFFQALVASSAAEGG